MLDRQLENARQAQQQQARRFGLVALALVIIILLSIAIINWSSSRSTTLTSGDGEPARSPNETVSEAALASAQENEQAREQFKQALKQFEQQTSGHLANTAISNWSSERHAALIGAKNEVLNAFARGEYQTALQQLAQVDTQTRQLVTDWELAFATALDSAKHFFAQDDVKRAQLNLNQALKIKPSDQDALALNERLKVLPEIEHLLSKFDVAQVENNLQQQAKVLQQVLTLDPNRQSLKTRLGEIKEKLSDRAFTAKIDLGLRALAKGDLYGARSASDQAEKIYPKRVELSLLKDKITQAQHAIDLQNALASLQPLIVADNWPQVLSTARSHLAKFKDNPKLQQTLALAVQLLTLTKQLDAYLSRVDRLTDTNIRSQAKTFHDNNQQVAQNSLSLTLKMLALEAVLSDLSTPVDVQVRSDGKTHIIVIGEGQIGKTTGRSLALSPGHYVFEGSRKGYRSTRVTIEILPKTTNQEVVVICHERI